MHRVQCGGSLLKLVAFDTTPPTAVGGGIPGALGLRYLTMYVSNLDEMVAACEAADVDCVPWCGGSRSVTLGSFGRG